MNLDIKKQWVKALRSGNYKQGHGVLKDPNTGKFCCLGVLCDLYASNGWSDTGRMLGEELELPIRVMEWAGLTEPNPSIEFRTVDKQPCNTLTEVNDNGMSFKKIAKIIEKEL